MSDISSKKESCDIKTMALYMPGNTCVPVIAGPCSAESREQVINTAVALSKAGVGTFRAGVWKPRTKPGNFEGIGEPALQWLKEVKEITGMRTATEVANRNHLQLALQYGVDVLWVGARTTTNPFAVQDISDALAEYADKGGEMPVVFVKNPLSPDIELWDGALQRLYNAGVRRIAAVHRGFSTYKPHIYRNAPEYRIPLELKLRYPELEIYFDPSHLGGSRQLIAPLSQDALDMGFNGLIIESHIAPDCALSDSAQQITPKQLAEILKVLRPRKTSVADKLDALRQQIDDIDRQLLEILAQRMEVSQRIGEYKRSRDIQVVQPDRYNDVMRSRIAAGDQLGLNPDFLRRILLEIHDESVRNQI